jgi:tetratricopeptide (TPR) repeat protein
MRLLSIVSALTTLVACSPVDSTPAHRVATPLDVALVDEQQCAECHVQEYEDWLGSHHDLAMQEVNETTVLGDFQDATFEAFGITSRFYRQGDGFWVDTEGPDGKVQPYQVRYVFGVEPLQQYLIEFPGGRQQCLTIAWDTVRKQWFHLQQEERIEPDDPYHWTGRFQNWNTMCADCHSTALKKGYDAESDTFNTTWEQLDVGCQACHGPGEAHVEWARQASVSGDSGDALDMGLVLDIAKTEPRTQIESCAPCHSRRHRMFDDWQPQLPFLDRFVPERLHDGFYHEDGQILDEVYVYGSFVQSRMYHAGVACSDCHQPHSGKLVLEGDGLCQQCHSVDAPVDRFPTLKAQNYATPEHHQHNPDLEGARCVNCHMPETTYMVVDPRRDHSFRIPRPDLSVRYGVPNACNQCHQDQNVRWAADSAKQWYGGPPETPHFSPELIRGRRGQGAQSRQALRDLSQDAEQPAIVRATALELLRGEEAEDLQAIQAAVNDEDALVRLGAARAMIILPPQLRIPFAVPLLEDPNRAVRMQAARILAPAPREQMPDSVGEQWNAALQEFIECQMCSADQPWAHLNLGSLYGDLNQLEKSEQAYLRALYLDDAFLPARVNLSHLYNQLTRNQEAIAVLQKGIDQYPNEGELHYSLGLVLAEENNLEAAVGALARAVSLNPGQPRQHYNLGMALQKLGHLEDAETALLEAHHLNDQDSDVTHAIALLFLEMKRYDDAMVFAENLHRLRPQDRTAMQLAQQIQRARGAP